MYATGWRTLLISALIAIGSLACTQAEVTVVATPTPDLGATVEAAVARALASLEPTPWPTPSPTPDFGNLHESTLACSGLQTTVLRPGYSDGSYEGGLFLNNSVARSRLSSRPSPITIMCVLMDDRTQQHWKRSGWAPLEIWCGLSFGGLRYSYGGSDKTVLVYRPSGGMHRYQGEFYLPESVAENQLSRNEQGEGPVLMEMSCNTTRWRRYN